MRIQKKLYMKACINNQFIWLESNTVEFLEMLEMLAICVVCKKSTQKDKFFQTQMDFSSVIHNGDVGKTS